MTGWNLPPGCTNADIDRAMGGDVQCFGCGADLADEPEPETVWHHGKSLPACSSCAARAEEDHRDE